MEVITPRGHHQAGTYLITTVSPLWPPSPRPPSGSCQSSWTSPRPPCPRRSPYSPWLRSQGRTDHSHAQANKKGLWCQPMPRNKDGATPLGNPALPCGLIKQLIVEFARTYTHTQKKQSAYLSWSLQSSEMKPKHWLCRCRAVTAGPCRKAQSPLSCIHPHARVVGLVRSRCSPPGQSGSSGILREILRGVHVTRTACRGASN